MPISSIEGNRTTTERRLKPCQSPQNLLDLSSKCWGIMLLVGAIMLAIGDPPAVRLAIVSGVAGVIFFILGGMANR
jgi:hypothetical protein